MLGSEIQGDFRQLTDQSTVPARLFFATDGLWFKVFPASGFGSITNCIVAVTPHTMRIFRIWAWGACERDCNTQAAVALTYLRQKYVAIGRNNETIDSDTITFRSGKRSVILHCGPEIGIEYKDEALAAVAKEEAAQPKREQFKRDLEKGKEQKSVL